MYFNEKIIKYYNMYVHNTQYWAFSTLSVKELVQGCT